MLTRVWPTQHWPESTAWPGMRVELPSQFHGELRLAPRGSAAHIRPMWIPANLCLSTLLQASVGHTDLQRGARHAAARSRAGEPSILNCTRPLQPPGRRPGVAETLDGSAGGEWPSYRRRLSTGCRRASAHIFFGAVYAAGYYSYKMGRGAGGRTPFEAFEEGRGVRRCDGGRWFFRDSILGTRRQLGTRWMPSSGFSRNGGARRAPAAQANRNRCREIRRLACC